MDDYSFEEDSDDAGLGAGFYGGGGGRPQLQPDLAAALLAAAAEEERERQDAGEDVADLSLDGGDVVPTDIERAHEARRQPALALPLPQQVVTELVQPTGQTGPGLR